MVHEVAGVEPQPAFRGLLSWRLVVMSLCAAPTVAPVEMSDEAFAVAGSGSPVRLAHATAASSSMTSDAIRHAYDSKVGAIVHDLADKIAGTTPNTHLQLSST